MSQTKRAYDKFLLYALPVICLGLVMFISATTIIDPSYINTTGPILGSTGTFSGALTGTTLDTGQGANELFDMDQNVLQASAVTFDTIDTGQGANELYDMNQNVQTNNAVIFSSVNTGFGANELYDMDQNVLTSSDVIFNDITVSDELTIGGVARTTWPTGTTQASDWLITGVSGTYTALSSTGTTFSSGVYSNIANWVFGNATSYQTIVQRGTFSVTTIITYPGQYVTIDNYGARFELDADIDRMFESYDYGNTMSRYIQTFGGIYDGNKAARSDGSAFKGCFKDSTWVDMKIIAFETEGIDLQSYDGTYKSNANFFTRCWFGTTPTGAGNKGGGVLIGNDGAGGSDNQFTQCFFINNGIFSLKIEDNCANNRVENVHFAGTAPVGETDQNAIWLYGDTDAFHIFNSHFENVDISAILIQPQGGDFNDRIRIIGCDFYQVHTATDNTTATIWVNSNVGASRMGAISDCHFMADAGNEPAYAIHLDGAGSSNWTLSNNIIQASGYQTAGIEDEGAGTIDDNNYVA